MHHLWSRGKISDLHENASKWDISIQSVLFHLITQKFSFYRRKALKVVPLKWKLWMVPVYMLLIVVLNTTSDFTASSNCGCKYAAN